MTVASGGTRATFRSVWTEAHLTLSHPAQAEPVLRSWLEPRAMRLACIELAQGAFPRQIMLTARLTGRPDDAIRDAHAIRGALAPLGIDVSRIKLEVAHTASSTLDPALYIEHHVKVRTAVEGVPALERLGAAHGAHLSRNPLTRRAGVEERFLTQRFPPHAPDAAERGLGALLAALRAASVTVAKIERERVVHDDNLALDAGWRPELAP